MEDFIVDKTFNTPQVHFSPSNGTLKIEGRSIPEDPGEFYDILLKELETYYQDPKDLTRIDIKLEYINSGSSKYLLELLRIVKRNYEKGHDCLVTWYYEEDDESIQELGQHFQATVGLPLKLQDYY